MAVFLSRPEQAYAARPQPYVVSATIPGGAVVRKIKLTLTRVSWPAGPVGKVDLVFPDGQRPSISFSGGPAFNKDGSPLLAPVTEWSAPDGIDFPSGSYRMEFTALQTVTSAVTVERF